MIGDSNGFRFESVKLFVGKEISFGADQEYERRFSLSLLKRGVDPRTGSGERVPLRQVKHHDDDVSAAVVTDLDRDEMFILFPSY